MYLFMTVLDLNCCVGFSLNAESKGYALGARGRLLAVVVSLAVEHGF